MCDVLLGGRRGWVIAVKNVLLRPLGVNISLSLEINRLHATNWM